MSEKKNDLRGISKLIPRRDRATSKFHDSLDGKLRLERESFVKAGALESLSVPRSTQVLLLGPEGPGLPLEYETESK